MSIMVVDPVRRPLGCSIPALLLVLWAAPAAHATKTCSEPGDEWERATPAEADMDAQKLQDATGETPEWSAHAFPDLEGDLRDSIQRIKESPFIPNKDSVRGFVYDVHTGRLREVEAA